MNRKMVFYTLGRILFLEAALLLLPLLCCAIYGEKEIFAFLITIAIAIVLSVLLTLFNKPKDRTIFAKEGFVIVALSWIVLSAIGALPFVISGAIPSYVDAFFETVSGFTTTGASILTNVESITSKGLLFWRSFTHWIGGMGVIVLIMAIVPTDSGRSMHIMRAEMPGPIVGKLVPKIKSTAKILYLIYICLTLLMVVFLYCGDMSLYESFVHAFGAAGTGGFGIKADSIESYSPYIQWVITIFMLIFGVNFNLYYLILMKKIVNVIKSEELWTYIIIVLASIGVVTYNVYPMYNNLSETIRHSAFQVSSIITTTGYATTDFNAWSVMPKTILFILMFIGGCAGSTAGGLKVSRIVLMFKNIKANLKHLLHSRSVETVRFEGNKVEDSTIVGTLNYFAIYFFCFTVIFLLICFEPFDFETNISAVAACFNNIGPGFAGVGPTSSFAAYSPFSKILLSFGMLLGRLEIYPILLLFTPKIWARNRKK
jgi:trk system potassium uptake protein TrkH